MTGRQACLRATAQSRDQYRERILVLPRWFALLHWAVTTVVVVLDLRRVSISSELESCFAQHVHLMLWSQPRILVPLDFLKCASVLPWLQLDSKTKFYPYFLSS